MVNNTEMKEKNLGPVTAYAYAVEGGFTGTKEEFEAGLVASATYLDQARDEVRRAEGFASGTKNGFPVDSDSPFYQNSARYFMDQAAAIAESVAGMSAEMSNYYSECSTEASTTIKSVTNNDIVALAPGLNIRVKFTYSNSAINPMLKINDLEAAYITVNGTDSPGASQLSSWKAGSVVSFTYDGDTWVMDGYQASGVHGIHFVQGTQLTTTNVWTGNLTDVDYLYNGLTIAYYLPHNGNGLEVTLTLELRDGPTSALPVYYFGNKRATSEYTTGSVIMLTHVGGAWRGADYNVDTNTHAIMIVDGTTRVDNDVMININTDKDVVPTTAGYNLVRFSSQISVSTNNLNYGKTMFQYSSGATKEVVIDGSSAFGIDRPLIVPKGTYFVYYDGTKFRMSITGYLYGMTATTSNDGLMSASDKIKLNGIAAGANNYVLPNAASNVRGGVMIEDTPTQNSTKAITSGAVYAAIANLNSVDFHICTSEEYDHGTGVPTIVAPDPNTFYLVPDSNGTGHDLFVEWVFRNSAWEIFGGARVDLTNYLQTTDVDSSPTSGSNKPVSSGGVYTALAAKPNADTHLTMSCNSQEMGALDVNGTMVNYIAYVVTVAGNFVPSGPGYSLIRFEQPFTYVNNTSGNVAYKIKIGSNYHDLSFGSASVLIYGGTRTVNKGSYLIFFDGNKFILRTDGFIPGMTATAEYDGLLSAQDKIKLNNLSSDLSDLVPKPETSPNGTSGQILSTNGDGSTSWIDNRAWIMVLDTVTKNTTSGGENYLAFNIKPNYSFDPTGSGYNLLQIPSAINISNDGYSRYYKIKMGDVIKTLKIDDNTSLGPNGTKTLSKGTYLIHYNATSGYSMSTSGRLTGENATASNQGLMSAEDKAKLNGIAANANNYTLPDATSSVIGGVMIEDTPTENSTKAITSGGVYAALANLNGVNFHICISGEYNSSTGVPTIQSPVEGTFYLVPTGEVSGNDLFDEWVYTNNVWEKFGSARVDLTGYLQTSDVDAVPTNGSSNPVSSDGVYDALAGKVDTSSIATTTETQEIISAWTVSA